MAKKYLAYINPIENPIGKECAYCNIMFISGDMNHKIWSNVRLSTNLFKYYFYGSALEVILLDEQMKIRDIHDITVEDARDFGLSLQYALTLNQSTFDMMATDGFTYNLKQNKFYNYCRNTVNEIYRTMQTHSGFLLRLYVIKGEIVYIELDDNPKRNRQYILSDGYIVTDKTKLRCVSGVGKAKLSNCNEKLKQEDIDRLIIELQS